MPHLFVCRPRVHSLFARPADEAADQQAKVHFNWERINTISYALGGILFILGSIFFIPKYEDKDPNFGSGGYLLGSLFYLLTSLHDLVEVRANAQLMRRQAAAAAANNTNNEGGTGTGTGTGGTISAAQNQQIMLEYHAVGIYLVGTVLFIIGSVLFTTGVAQYIAGAYCFIFGSLAFAVGGAVNALMDTTYVQVLQQVRLTTITAVFYIVGSVLFLVASVPFLWKEEDTSEILFSFLAWQYIVGSIFFLLGGWCNYGKARKALEVLLDDLTADQADYNLNSPN